MNARQKPFHFRDARRTTPHPEFDLHKLLAKELGVRRTHKHRNWTALAFGISAFLGGLTIFSQVPAGTNVALRSEVNERQAISDRIREYKHIHIAEIALSAFSRANGLAAHWNNASPIALGLMFNEVSSSPPSRNTASLRARPIPRTRTALPHEAQIELQFWRPIARSGDAERYESYLRRYPAGAFADIAAAKVKALRRATKGAAVERGRTNKNEASAHPSQDITENNSAQMLEEPALSAKTADRCWYRNIEACRQRCREGEIRACQKLGRFGG